MEECNCGVRPESWGRSWAVAYGLFLAAVVAGCQQKMRGETADVPVVPVSHPVERVVTDYVDFTGRTNAVQSVDIIARVTGYLVQMPFKEGSEVKAGDLLFQIDPRPYQAQYDQAKSQVDLDKAQLDLAKSTLARYEALNKTTPGAVSEQALDQYKASVTEADARVVAQQKSLEVYNLNKEFTHVVSPIDGQVSRYYLTRGNLVNQDQTLLTTIVSLDPMYVYFDVDESTWLRILDLIKAKKIVAPAEGGLPVLLGLQNEEGFPHQAVVNFVNNQINSTTGSITMRGTFPNPPLIVEQGAESGEQGVRKDILLPAPGSPLPASAPVAASERPSIAHQFSPGMFVRVRLPIGQPHQALLIIDRAIQSDQGLKYVYVLDAQNKAQTRSIKTGALQEDGLRVVEGEIKPDDLVIVGAIQQVRAQMEVKPDERPMPTLGGQTDAGGAREAGPPHATASTPIPGSHGGSAPPSLPPASSGAKRIAKK